MVPRPPCSVAGCDKLVRSRGLCIKHGGGKRCAHEGCNASAEGAKPFCLQHGGGRKRPNCAAEGCNHLARSGTSYCTGHGGGPICRMEGCINRASWRHAFCKDCRAIGHSCSGSETSENGEPSIPMDVWCRMTPEEMLEAARNLKTEYNGENGVENKEFFETSKDMSEEEAEEVDDEEHAGQTRSEFSQEIPIDDFDVEGGAEQPLDDFIIFRRGIDYRKHVVLPENFMSGLYKQSYGRS